MYIIILYYFPGRMLSIIFFILLTLLCDFPTPGSGPANPGMWVSTLERSVHYSYSRLDQYGSGASWGKLKMGWAILRFIVEDPVFCFSLRVPLGNLVPIQPADKLRKFDTSRHPVKLGPWCIGAV